MTDDISGVHKNTNTQSNNAVWEQHSVAGLAEPSVDRTNKKYNLFNFDLLN